MKLLCPTQDGDFLVRESPAVHQQGKQKKRRQTRSQFVLTGVQGGARRHLLLVDPEGAVRTRDRRFRSVSHLVEFHLESQVPIVSADSALR